MIREHATASVSRVASLIVLTLTLVLLGPLAPQNASSPGPFKLRLIIPEPQQCLGTRKLAMEALFTNSGDSSIPIYPSSIYDFSFIKTVTHGERSKVESHEVRKDVGTGDPALRETPVVLQPQTPLIVPLKYDLSDTFFSEPGVYSVRVSYVKIKTTATPIGATVANIESNDVLFQINECQ